MANTPLDAKTNFLDTLQTELILDIEKAAGLGSLKETLVSKPTDYKLLTTAQFKHLRDQLKLHPFLPKPPALAEYAFLLQKKGGALLKEQFEDQWQAATLNYAAAAAVFTHLVEAANEQENAPNPPLQAAATNLLTASNVLARALHGHLPGHRNPPSAQILRETRTRKRKSPLPRRRKVPASIH